MIKMHDHVINMHEHDVIDDDNYVINICKNSMA